jgi:hypothetical protein
MSEAYAFRVGSETCYADERGRGLVDCFVLE